MGQARADGTHTVTQANREAQRRRRLISAPALQRREMRKVAGTWRSPRDYSCYLRRERRGAGVATAAFRRPLPNLRRQHRHTQAGIVAASTPAARTLDCGRSSPSLSGGLPHTPSRLRPAALTRRPKRSPGVGSLLTPSFPQRHFTADRQLRPAGHHTEAKSR